MPGGGTALRISLVAALDRNRAIGRGNALPWHLPDDFRRFKALTMGKPILMGRRTADSLGRALPGRRNLVLTRGGRVPFAGMEAVASVDAALRAAEEAGAGWHCDAAWTGTSPAPAHSAARTRSHGTCLTCCDASRRGP